MEEIRHPESLEVSLTAEAHIDESDFQEKSEDSPSSDIPANEPDWSKEVGSDAMMGTDILERIARESSEFNDSE